MANKFLSNGFRSQIPPLSVPTFLSTYNKMALTAVKELEKCKNSTLSAVGHNIKMALAEAKEDTVLGIASCRVYNIVYQKPQELQNCVHPPDERKKTIKAPLQKIDGLDHFFFKVCLLQTMTPLVVDLVR